MAIALKTIKYVLREDRALPADQQTVFKLRPLTVYDQLKLSEAEASENVQRATDMVSTKLVGWTNFKDEDGREVPFNADEALSFLTFGQTLELFRAALGIETVDEGEPVP